MSNSQRLFLSGRSRSNVGQVARRVADAGGRAHAAVVDASKEAAVGEYFDSVAKQAASADIVFNAVARSNATETVVFDTRACSRTSRNNFMISP